MEQLHEETFRKMKNAERMLKTRMTSTWIDKSDMPELRNPAQSLEFRGVDQADHGVWKRNIPPDRITKGFPGTVVKKIKVRHRHRESVPFGWVV